MNLRDAQVEAAWRLRALRPLGTGRVMWSLVWPELRATLAEAQGWRCCYCGRRMSDTCRRPHSATLEHVVPLCLGGEDHPDNLAVACKRCNDLRGARPVLIGDELWGLPGGPVPVSAAPVHDPFVVPAP